VIWGNLLDRQMNVVERIDSAKQRQYIESMQITFTQHALVRMAERGITQDEVLATLAQYGATP
jgi:Domain of unknown function (DUF4258)